MMRLILIIIGLAVGILCGVTTALFHFFGWKGLLALPFLLIAIFRIGKKIAVSTLVPKPIDSEEQEFDNERRRRRASPG